MGYTRDPKPPLWLALAAVAAAVAFNAYVRVWYFTEAVVPMTYDVFLLLALWHRRRWLHFALAAAFTLMAALKVFELAAPNPHLAASTAFVMLLVNIWVVALVVDGLVLAQGRLRRSYSHLADVNAELEASNEELAAREEEISAQNEELQRQTEELEQQMEESQEQAEELQQQSEVLQELRSLSVAREHVLQSLYHTATTLNVDGESDLACNRICDAAVQAFANEVAAALLLELVDGQLVVRGQSGIAEAERERLDQRQADPFAGMVVENARPAGIEDLRRTPEVAAFQSSQGESVQAALAAPLMRKQLVTGVLIVYSSAPRNWSESDFQTLEWLAAQGSLLLESMRLQAEIERRGDEADEASQRKTQFLAAVSHDIRTPANAINLMAEVLERAEQHPELADEIPDMIRGLRSNARQLVELVSDVLDISRLDSGKIELDLSDFDFVKVIADEVRQYQVMADNAGLELRCQTPDEPLWVRSDRMKLIRIVENLLGNAIKFTERGSVVVSVAHGPAGLELSIADTGVGIPPRELEHIFDEFYQVRNPERDRSKGTGLGLAICRRLLDALGCTLSVKSAVGEGSTFTIRLPQDALISPPEVPDVSAEDGQLADLAGLRVLLVEDHKSTRAAVASLLGMHGARVDQASDARQAIHSLRHSEPDVLLLDLMLPDLDGREVLRHLKEHRPDTLRAVLVISGDIVDQRRKEVLSLGADDLIAKPIDMSALVGQITRRLELDGNAI